MGESREGFLEVMLTEVLGLGETLKKHQERTSI